MIGLQLLWLAVLHAIPAAGAPPPAPGGDYDLAAEIAIIRSHPEYGALFTDTSDPYAPAGLQAPTAPAGSLTPVSVSTLADLRTACQTNGRVVTLTPGTYTEAGSTNACIVIAQDVRLVLTGCTINGPDGYKGISTSYLSRRVEVVGGTFTNGWDIQGRDIMLKGCVFNTPGTYTFAGNEVARNAGEIYGHRICFLGCTGTGMYGGAFFTGAATEALMQMSITTTVMTVDAVFAGQLNVGDQVVGINVLPVIGTTIVNQLTGTPGGAGTYTVSVSQTVANGFANGKSRSTNLILANSSLEVPVAVGDAPVHENTVRFNGVNFGVVMDSRLRCYPKTTVRWHPDYSTKRNSGTVGLFRTQYEHNGFTAQSGPGIWPAVENIVIDENTYYAIDNATGGGRGAIPYYGTIDALDTTGDGTTATMNFSTDFAQVGHGLETGDFIDVNVLFGDTGYNATNVAITKTGAQSFTYLSTGTGTGSVALVTTRKVSTPYIYMNGHRSFSATAEGAVDAAVVPGGAGSPDAGWDLSDNLFKTWVTAPAWAVEPLA